MLIIFDLDDTLYDKTGQIHEKTKWQDVTKIIPFPGVLDFLRSFAGKKMLVTKETDQGLQMLKIETLGLRLYFDEILICHSDEEKRTLFKSIKKKYPQEKIWAVGDRLDTDIFFAKEAGFIAVHLKHGKYQHLPAVVKPDYQITAFSQLPGLLE